MHIPNLFSFLSLLLLLLVVVVVLVLLSCIHIQWCAFPFGLATFDPVGKTYLGFRLAWRSTSLWHYSWFLLNDRKCLAGEEVEFPAFNNSTFSSSSANIISTLLLNIWRIYSKAMHHLLICLFVFSVQSSALPSGNGK